MTTVAFQGALGANSHLACRAACPEATVLPCRTFDEVFEAVETGRADLAMLPVENSQAGRVADMHRLIPVHRLSILAEHYQPVHHQLLGLRGASLEGLRTVRSHPQALAQCRAFLRSRGLEPVAAHDTAGAAEEIAELGDPSVGALASELAAEIYGLDILAADVEDAHDNTTRFLLMALDPQVPARGETTLITSALFRVRNIPAALYKALGGFATNGINLLKLESYQLPGFRWAQFAIDFEGHPDDPPIARALEELAFFSTEIRLLGTYPAHPFRDRNQD